MQGGRTVSRVVGWILVLGGIVSQSGGRLLDAGDHPRLDGAARVLNAAGASVLVTGVLLVLAGRWLYGRDEPSLGLRAAQVAVPLVGAAALGVASLAVVGPGSSSPAAADGATTTAHTHDEPVGAASTATPTTLVAGADAGQTQVAAQITASATHEHGVAVPEQPMTAADRATLGAQLVQARQAALRYPSVADAEAAGYRMVTPYLPLIGAHYIRWDLMDGNFDISHPEMLLYDGTQPTSKIVGLSYYMFSDKEPDEFAGPNDHWHQHIGLCLRDNVVIGPESMSAAACQARGGTKVDASNGWMIHVWVVPGWESPEGVFSPEQPGLT